MEPPSSLRVDKWLWAARFFKTRSLAAAACAGGKVDVNDDAAKPARLVRGGDVIKVTLPRGRRRVARVLVLDDRRGSGEAARRLYEDLTPRNHRGSVRRVPRCARRAPAGRPSASVGISTSCAGGDWPPTVSNAPTPTAAGLRSDRESIRR